MLQVQPQFSDRAAWEALAEREELFYEPLELSMGQPVTEEILRWYRGCGRVRALHGVFIDNNPAGGDPDLRALSRQRCHESCRLAGELGARHVIFHGSAFPFLRGAYLEHWADTCAEFYTQLAERYDLTVCVENSQDLDPEPLFALFRRIGSDRVRVCLDVGHANYSRVSVSEWFDRLGDSIGYLHLSDNHGSFGDHLPLGEGSVDWHEAHEGWKALGRRIPITVEVGTPEGAERSLAFLRRHGLFGMEGER